MRTFLPGGRGAKTEVREANELVKGVVKLKGLTIEESLWASDAHLERARVRYGIGYGELYTPVQPVAIGMDGPAFHHAREAITSARKRGWRGGVFAGFGDWQDRVLNGLARLLERHSERLTAKQREIAGMMRHGLEQTEIAEQLGVTRQAVSDHVRAMGWEAFAEGEEALRLALGQLPQCR